MIRFIFMLLFAGCATMVLAQKNSREVIIRTRVYCDHCSACETCRSRVETALYKIKGVKLCSMDGAQQTVRVVYNPARTDVQTIRLAIARCGYDADSVKAAEDGYRLLDGCCRRKNE